MPTYSVPVHLLTYAVGFGRIKPEIIFETLPNRAKLTINGLYKAVYWFSIAAKMYDLE